MPAVHTRITIIVGMLLYSPLYYWCTLTTRSSSSPDDIELYSSERAL